VAARLVDGGDGATAMLADGGGALRACGGGAGGAAGFSTAGSGVGGTFSLFSFRPVATGINGTGVGAGGNSLKVAGEAGWLVARGASDPA
jgi:hypothetical protein